jgi:hypothetical protein
MNQMTTINWRSEVRLTTNIEAAEHSAAEEPSNQRPFVIVVLGDFRGTANGVPRDHMTPLHNRRVLDIDRDNFDAILARLGVRWEATLGGLPGQGEAGVTAQLALNTLDDFHPGRMRGLPLYIYHEGAMTLTKPCAEVLLSERVVQALEEASLMPLISYRDAGIVALPYIQSLGEPRSPVRWNR